TWDPNPALESVTGYLVYIATAPGLYTEIIDVGNQTTFVYPTAGVGQQYYFAVLAYNAAGIGGSIEVSGISESSGLMPGDVASCTGTASFDTANAGASKVVTVTGLTLTGPAALNYTLASPTTTTTAAILPA